MNTHHNHSTLLAASRVQKMLVTLFIGVAFCFASCSNPGDIGDPIAIEPAKPFAVTLAAQDITLSDNDDATGSDGMFDYTLADASAYYPVGTDAAIITLDTSSRIPVLTKLRLAFVPKVQSAPEAALAPTQRILLALDSIPVTGAGPVLLNNGQIQCRVRTEDNPPRIELVPIRQQKQPPYRKDDSFAMIELSKFTARNVIRAELQIQLVYERKIRTRIGDRKVEVRSRVSGVFFINYEPKK
ncbi:MAG: hypothetical protein JNL32_00925 [Candidatus Kapabacteria bacterium]|nr:hypothetical protein [Candidatus Kapabacteria bacterium]